MKILAKSGKVAQNGNFPLMEIFPANSLAEDEAVYPPGEPLFSSIFQLNTCFYHNDLAKDQTRGL